MLWGLPLVVLLQCALSLIPKSRASRQGSRYIDASGFPVEQDNCVSSSWAAMWARYGPHRRSTDRNPLHG